MSRLWFCRTLLLDRWVSWAFSRVRRSSCWRGLESGPAGVWCGPPSTRPLRRVWFPAAPCQCLTPAVVSTWTAFSHLGKVSYTHTNINRPQTLIMCHFLMATLNHHPKLPLAVQWQVPLGDVIWKCNAISLLASQYFDILLSMSLSFGTIGAFVFISILADTFIQSVLHYIQGMHLITSYIPWEPNPSLLCC